MTQNSMVDTNAVHNSIHELIELIHFYGQNELKYCLDQCELN